MTWDDGVFFRDENGAVYGVKQVNGKPRISSMPYTYDIAEGNVSGHEPFAAWGSRIDVQVVATGSDVWPGVAATQPSPVDAGEQLEVVSTSAEDGVAGTGVVTMQLHYLDAAGNPQEETITMNGTTPVPLSESNVRFIQDFHALTVGTTGAAVGLITLYKQGAASTVYSQIDIGRNRALSCARMVPLGKTLYIAGGYATATTKSIVIELRITANSGVLLPGVFMEHGGWFLQDSVVATPLLFPILCPALSKVKLTAFVPAGKAGGDISAGFEGWLE